ncbi:hypothetical protein SAMN06295885_2630 [Rathayibacter oskolensis]|uniref:Uncharacterized protein n=1 Tax=Rathayibacter oskolensis TaxID=1891671 RepID=A0A1X7P4X2_9MICO|nr:hypothetical protein [Rathayibacter oskolensis]SMH45845.1 hypothetical protein SAMN06295885_2630 [Rathayibacter oskolensis]
MTGFVARPRSDEDDSAKSERLIAEVDRLLSRIARASRDGREEFLAA